MASVKENAMITDQIPSTPAYVREVGNILFPFVGKEDISSLFHHLLLVTWQGEQGIGATDKRSCRVLPFSWGQLPGGVALAPGACKKGLLERVPNWEAPQNLFDKICGSRRSGQTEVLCDRRMLLSATQACIRALAPLLQKQAEEEAAQQKQQREAGRLERERHREENKNIRKRNQDRLDAWKSEREEAKKAKRRPPLRPVLERIHQRKTPRKPYEYKERLKRPYPYLRLEVQEEEKVLVLSARMTTADGLDSPAHTERCPVVVSVRGSMPRMEVDPSLLLRMIRSFAQPTLRLSLVGDRDPIQFDPFPNEAGNAGLVMPLKPRKAP